MDLIRNLELYNEHGMEGDGGNTKKRKGVRNRGTAEDIAWNV